jgi:hypothetical protein
MDMEVGSNSNDPLESSEIITQTKEVERQENQSHEPQVAGHDEKMDEADNQENLANKEQTSGVNNITPIPQINVEEVLGQLNVSNLTIDEAIAINRTNAEVRSDALDYLKNMHRDGKMSEQQLIQYAKLALGQVTDFQANAEAFVATKSRDVQGSQPEVIPANDQMTAQSVTEEVPITMERQTENKIKLINRKNFKKVEKTSNIQTDTQIPQTKPSAKPIVQENLQPNSNELEKMRKTFAEKVADHKKAFMELKAEQDKFKLFTTMCAEQQGSSTVQFDAELESAGLSTFEEATRVSDNIDNDQEAINVANYYNEQETVGRLGDDGICDDKEAGDRIFDADPDFDNFNPNYESGSNSNESL